MIRMRSFGPLALLLGLTIAVSPMLAEAAGYWLSAELVGTAKTRSAAVTAMAPNDPGAATTPPPLAGHFVGNVADLPAALKWIERWAFSGPNLPAIDSRELSFGPAPVPGGDLIDGFGSFLLALVIDEIDDDGGSRAFTWPEPMPELPSSWIPAAILSQQAPLFAAPAPHLPPLSESYDTVLRSDDLYFLGVVDRCESGSGPRECLRWAQVLVHGQGRWRSGYLPASQAAVIDGWLRAPAGLPRVQIVPAAIVGDEALFVLILRTRDYELHRSTLRLRSTADSFPKLDLALSADEVIVSSEGTEVARRPLSASIDAR